MKINEKIAKVRSECMADPNEGKNLADLAFAALDAGMGSTAWRKLMSRFTDDQDELRRLNGLDEEFNEKQWGKFCLAYMLGDSTCTSETAMETGTHRTMSLPALADRKMKDLLDAEGDDLAEFP